MKPNSPIAAQPKEYKAKKIRATDFMFCPQCGKKTVSFVNGKKWICSSCGFELYHNVAAACGLIVFDEMQNILFEKRAKNPRKGFLALPGGFINAEESAEEAAMRECNEELCFSPKKISYLASFPNTYEYKNALYKTCDIFFEAEVSAPLLLLTEKMQMQKTEVSDICIYKIENESGIEKTPLAFESAKNVLRFWLSKKNEKK